MIVRWTSDCGVLLDKEYWELQSQSDLQVTCSCHDLLLHRTWLVLWTQLERLTTDVNSASIFFSLNLAADSRNKKPQCSSFSPPTEASRRLQPTLTWPGAIRTKQSQRSEVVRTAELVHKARGTLLQGLWETAQHGKGSAYKRHRLQTAPPTNGTACIRYLLQTALQVVCRLPWCVWLQRVVLTIPWVFALAYTHSPR